MVPDGRYADWEAIYRDNVTWVYRTIFGVSAISPMRKISQPRYFWPRWGRCGFRQTIPEVRAYRRATARTALAAHWRATLGREITSIEDIAAVPDSEEASSMAPQRVRVVLEALPDNYRRILELRFLQGCSIKDSATEMGVSVANAKVLQHRALQRAAQVNGTTSGDRARDAAIYR